MKLEDARRLQPGDLVRMLCGGGGGVDFSDYEGDQMAEDDDGERTYDPGVVAEVSDVRTFPNRQGWAVTVVILEGPGRWLVNCFDEADDEPRYPFEPLIDPADLERGAQLKAASLADIESGAYELQQLRPPLPPLEELAQAWAEREFKMNDEDAEDGPQSPTGDDYNDLEASVRRFLARSGFLGIGYSDPLRFEVVRNIAQNPVDARNKRE